MMTDNLPTTSTPPSATSSSASTSRPSRIRNLSKASSSSSLPIDRDVDRTSRSAHQSDSESAAISKSSSMSMPKKKQNKELEKEGDRVKQLKGKSKSKNRNSFFSGMMGGSKKDKDKDRDREGSSNRRPSTSDGSSSPSPFKPKSSKMWKSEREVESDRENSTVGRNLGKRKEKELLIGNGIVNRDLLELDQHPAFKKSEEIGENYDRMGDDEILKAKRDLALAIKNQELSDPSTDRKEVKKGKRKQGISEDDLEGEDPINPTNSLERSSDENQQLQEISFSDPINPLQRQSQSQPASSTFETSISTPTLSEFGQTSGSLTPVPSVKISSLRKHSSPATGSSSNSNSTPISILTTNLDPTASNTTPNSISQTSPPPSASTFRSSTSPNGFGRSAGSASLSKAGSQNLTSLLNGMEDEEGDDEEEEDDEERRSREKQGNRMT